MQPRSLAQVLTELDSVYNPQIESIRQRQAAVPQSVEADIREAEGAQTRAFGNILSGARRRGTGVAFGGIPLGEQAEYSSTVFAPSVLRAKVAGRERAMSLEDAILGINERRATQGQSIYQNEQTMAEQRRQFDAQQRLAREQMAAQRAAAGGGFSPSFGGAAPSQRAAGPRTDPNLQAAYNNVATFLSQGEAAARSDFMATMNSARRGNVMDQLKIRLYTQLKPDWFNSAPVSSLGVANADRLRF